MGDDMFIIAYEQAVIMHDQRHIHVIMNIIVNPTPGQNLGDPRNETRRTQHSNMLIRPNDILRKTWMMKKKKSENCTTLVVLNAMCSPPF